MKWPRDTPDNILTFWEQKLNLSDFICVKNWHFATLVFACSQCVSSGAGAGSRETICSRNWMETENRKTNQTVAKCNECPIKCRNASCWFAFRCRGFSADLSRVAIGEIGTGGRCRDSDWNRTQYEFCCSFEQYFTHPNGTQKEGVNFPRCAVMNNERTDIPWLMS